MNKKKKDRTTITIDPELVTLAKQKNINISQSCELILNILFEIEDKDETALKNQITETENEIQNLKLKLQVYNKELETLRSEKQENKLEFEQNLSWKKSLKMYEENYMDVPTDQLHETAELLEVAPDKLKDMVAAAYKDRSSGNPNKINPDWKDYL